MKGSTSANLGWGHGHTRRRKLKKRKTRYLAATGFLTLLTMREDASTREPQSLVIPYLCSYAEIVNIWLPERSMPNNFTAQQILDLEAVLSPPRFGTYLREASGDRHKAMELYCWNTDISAAFYVMLQFCELSIRNGAVEAVEAVFGPNWHLNRGFVYTLPVLRGGRGYQPRKDLRSCATRLPTAGKVIAELKFAFWQHLFVRGQQTRIWDAHFAISFPGYDKAITLAQARAQMFYHIENIRKLRNRIAHHEPIFARNLAKDRDRIRQVIEWRRTGTAQWVDSIEQVTALLAAQP